MPSRCVKPWQALQTSFTSGKSDSQFLISLLVVVVCHCPRAMNACMKHMMDSHPSMAASLEVERLSSTSISCILLTSACILRFNCLATSFCFSYSDFQSCALWPPSPCFETGLIPFAACSVVLGIVGVESGPRGVLA